MVITLLTRETNKGEDLGSYLQVQEGLQDHAPHPLQLRTDVHWYLHITKFVHGHVSPR